VPGDAKPTVAIGDNAAAAVVSVAGGRAGHSDRREEGEAMTDAKTDPITAEEIRAILADDALWEAHNAATVEALHDASSAEDYCDEQECAEVWLPETIPSRVGAVLAGSAAVAALVAERHAALVAEIERLRGDQEFRAVREERNAATAEVVRLRAWEKRARAAMDRANLHGYPDDVLADELRAVLKEVV
jgi:hypothetical protein